MAAAAAGLTALLYSVFFTADLFGLWFTGDDLMNMYGAFTTPWSDLVRSCVMFWSPSYRPIGQVFYRALYGWFGLNPAAFHVVQFAVNGLSLWFAYCLARRIAGRRLAAALAILPLAYHTRFVEIWMFSTIYDSLTFLFCSAALLLYVRIRQQDRMPSARETAVLLLLYLCALNSKELSITLPALVFLFDAVIVRDVSRRTLFSPFLIVSLLMAAAFAAGKLQPGSGNPLSNNPDYAMHFHWKRWISNIGMYADNWLFTVNRFNRQPAGWRLLGVTFAAALLSRRLLYCWLAILISTLPVVFLPPRGGFAVWWPSFFAALYFAVVVTGALDWIGGRLRWRSWNRAAPAIAYGLLLCFLVAENHYQKPFSLVGPVNTITPGRLTYERLARKFTFQPGESIFFYDDLTGDNWELYFLLALHTGDPTLFVRRARQGFKPADAEFSRFFTLDDGEYVELRR